jgi:serine protease Do
LSEEARRLSLTRKERGEKMKALVAGVLGVAILEAQVPLSRNGPRNLSEFSASIEQLANAARPAVVQISAARRGLVENGQGEFVAEQVTSGSGIIVDPDGYIVTNAHVVKYARRIDVSVFQDRGSERNPDYKHFRAEVVGLDQETDLAVLKIDAKGLPTLYFLDSDTLKQGQLVVALGSPLGLQNSLTVGFISAPVRYLSKDNPAFYIQTDTPINPGNSGGPLLDTAGRVAGINTMILSQSGGSEGIGLAIPSNIVQPVYQNLRKEGRIRRGTIGIVSQDISPVLAAALGLARDSGIILSDVLPHGAAEAAGLQPGDVVLAADDRPLRDSRQLAAVVFQHCLGDEITLDIQRGQQVIRKVVGVLERPRSADDLAGLASSEAHLIRRLGILALTVDDKVTAILPGLRRLSGVVVAAIPFEFAGLNPGLLQGDVIYAINGTVVGNIEELRSWLDQKRMGVPIALQVEREGRLIYVAFELE